MKKYLFAISLLSITGFINCSNSAHDQIVSPPSNSILASITASDTNWTKKMEKSESYWKENLTDRQYYVLREKGTERAFTHEYNNNHDVGLFVCAACNNPLFSSITKFNSGSGWPSFYAPYFTKSVEVGLDNSLGISRDEVVCARCEGHLGHVFNDGPEPTGLRYCINGEALAFQGEQTSRTAVFAQGCFWCLEEIFEKVKGVSTVVSGYSGGTETNPTYKSVGSGQTSHAESIEVTYDPNVISYSQLLKVYFNSGDITQVDGQGNDRGRQYRSILFYNNPEEKRLAESYIKTLSKSGAYNKPIAVELVPFEKFYIAEDYHQDYVKLNPNQGYVKAVSIPRYEKAIKKFPELLKED